MGQENIIPLVSVVILSYKNSEETLECLASLEMQSYQDFEVIVVDNGSGYGELRRLEEYARRSNFNLRLVALDTNTAMGARNEGVKHARGDYLAFLDSDTTVDKDWLQELVKPLLRDGSQAIGATTSTILNYFHPDVVEYGGHSRINIFGQSKASDTIRPLGETYAVAGASFMMPRAAIGALQELYCPVYFILWEEIDISWRLVSLGYRLEYVPTSIVCHRITTTHRTRWGPGTVTLGTRNKYLTFYRNLSYTKFLLQLPLLLIYDFSTAIGVLLLGRDPRFLVAKLKGIAQFVRAIKEVPHIGGGAFSYLDKRLYLDKLG